MATSAPHPSAHRTGAVSQKASNPWTRYNGVLRLPQAQTSVSVLMGMRSSPFSATSALGIAALTSAWLCLSLAGVGSPSGAQAQPIPDAVPCAVVWVPPLSVRLLDGTAYGASERGGEALHQVLRQARQWLCTARSYRELPNAQTLYAALVRHTKLRFAHVRFDGADFKHAYVLLTELDGAAQSHYAWHLRLDRTADAWRVILARDVPSALLSDL